ncbi:MAG: hypothetical protein MJ137_02420 [Clostridia bacterium]|nr:hypothetical protein [Clostridia bacterium]
MKSKHVFQFLHVSSAIKLTVFILSAALLVPLAVSCAKPDTPNTETTASAATQGTGDTTLPADTEITDDIPAGTDFDGETVSVLYWEDAENTEYFTDGEKGEMVGDAIFRRNAKVEDRLKIKFEFVPTKGNSGNSENFKTTVYNNVNAGGDAYDIISAHSRAIGLTAYSGLTRELTEYPVINLSKPWWPESLVTSSSIAGKTYFVSGDISTNLLYMMYVVFYNKNMTSDLHITDPYTFFKDGTWTIDKLIELSNGVYSDVDGNGIASADDRYALYSNVLHTDAFFFGSDIGGIDNSGNTLKLSEKFTGEKMGTLVEKLQTLYASPDAALGSSSGYKPVFRDGRALFIVDRADIAISDLNEKTFDMGVLPAPKYDENQEKYLTAVGNPFSLYSVPVNASEPERAATVIEAWASESYRTVTPAVFEITMKTKYAEGGEDAEVYDVVRRGTVFDLSRIFWKVFSSDSAPDSLFQKAISGTASWSTVVGNKKPLQNTIKKIFDAFEK